MVIKISNITGGKDLPSEETVDITEALREMVMEHLGETYDQRVDDFTIEVVND